MTIGRLRLLSHLGGPALAWGLALQLCSASSDAAPRHFVLRSLEFSVGTSLSAITVHGKADPAAGGASGFQGEAVFGSAGLTAGQLMSLAAFALGSILWTAWTRRAQPRP
jgi:hypothetical protein